MFKRFGALCFDKRAISAAKLYYIPRNTTLRSIVCQSRRPHKNLSESGKIHDDGNISRMQTERRKYSTSSDADSGLRESHSAPRSWIPRESTWSEFCRFEVESMDQPSPGFTCRASSRVRLFAPSQSTLFTHTPTYFVQNSFMYFTTWYIRNDPIWTRKLLIFIYYITFVSSRFFIFYVCGLCEISPCEISLAYSIFQVQSVRRNYSLFTLTWILYLRFFIKKKKKILRERSRWPVFRKRFIKCKHKSAAKLLQVMKWVRRFTKGSLHAVGC